MALRLIVAPQAWRDLDEIAAFVAQHNASAAYNILLRIEQVVDRLCEHPFLGPVVIKPRRPGLRKMTVAPYIIFYRSDGDVLEVVRVLHSSRDVQEELPVDK